MNWWPRTPIRPRTGWRCTVGDTWSYTEQLGWLAINSRRNAGLNSRAAYRDPMTMDDYLGARPVSLPFGLFDCDVPIDGSIAHVVSHADYAADCPNPAVKVEAIGGNGALVQFPG